MQLRSNLQKAGKNCFSKTEIQAQANGGIYYVYTFLKLVIKHLINYV